MAIILKSDSTKLNGSYVTLEEADDYFNNLLGGEQWAEIEDDIKIKALITATMQIDSLNFIGFKLNPNQPLAFPRVSRPLTDTELIKYQSRKVDIPIEVKKATLEQAFWLIKQNTQSRTDEYANMQEHNIKSYAVGDVRIDFDLERYNKAQGIYLGAKSLLNKYLVRYTRLI